MSLFPKKKQPTPAPPQPTPAQPPPPPPPAKQKPDSPQPKTDAALKLPLPDLFAFQSDATRPQLDGQELKRRSPRGTILLVEADDEIRRLLSRLLQHEGYELHTASCLAEACEMLKHTPADHILARRACVPLNLETQIVLQNLSRQVNVRIVDEFSDLIMGQVVDYQSLSQCLLSLAGLLVSLLEGAHSANRGHAQTVAKYCRLVGQRLGMSRRDLDALTLAAYLHDIGPLELHHSISELSPNQDQPAKPPSLLSSLELLGNLPPAYPINELLAAVHDPADTGPHSHDTPPPPLAARILRVVETYDTLRRCHADQLPDDAAVFNWMRNQPAGTFDVDALETLIHIRRSESAIRNMELFSQTVLLVSSQPKDLHPLCLRLQNDDYKVLTACSVPEALQHLHQQPVSLVLTDYHFPAEQTGLDLLRTVKNDPNLRDIPVVVHDTPDTDLVKKTLQLGAEDWYPKPANVEITALKLGRILQRLSTRTSPPAGVQGNLREMPLLDIVQILSVNRRSVQIQLCRGSEEAQLFMHEGQIINATCRHLEGEAAALEILRWQDGTFWIHPLRQPPAVRITTSTETLLFHTGAQKPPPPPTIPPTTKSQPT